jgi:hypothetical protein
MYLVVTLGSTIVMMRIFGKYGLFAMLVLSSILINIQTVKMADVFGMTLVLGTISYSSLYLTTDLISEVYGKKSAKIAVWLGFISIILTTFFMQFVLWMKPAPQDFADPALHTIFSILPRITLASIIAYIFSQHIDVNLFHFWKRVTNGKHLWLRNNGSTLISQMIDSIIFFHIAYFGVMPYNTVWTLIISTYLFKLMIGVIDTGFIYMGVNWMKNKKPIYDLEKKINAAEAEL